MPRDETTYPPSDDGPATMSLPGSPTSDAGGALPFHTGDVIDGKYRLEGVLGAGGMGVVFEATHLALDERVAIKLVRDGAGGERLRREARIALRIKGEHAVRAMDVGSLPSGAPYVVMERLTGQNLADVLRARGPLPIEDAIDYVLQACEAMAEAHALGVVHRDLKPSNLFLTRRPDGSPLVKVLDFGIAKALALASVDGAPLVSLTASDAVLGSPQYMAPEQVRGARDVDARADVWAMGVMLHELLAGAPPFAGEVPSAVVAAIAADAPARLREARPEVPEGLAAVVLGCLEKDPARRTPSIGALAAALEPFAPPRARVSIERVARITAQGGHDGGRPPIPPGPAGVPPVESTPPPPPQPPSAVAISIERNPPPAARGPWRALAVLGAVGGVAMIAVTMRATPPAAEPRAATASAVTAATSQATVTAPQSSAPSATATAVAAPPTATATSLAAPPTASARAPEPAKPAARRAPPSKPVPTATPGVDVEAATAQRH